MKRVALLWAGIIIGCTFIATPAKFQAPDLSLPVALEIGHVTFRWVGMVEAIFAPILLVAFFRGVSKWVLVPIGILVVQWAAVMPLLDAATVSEMGGKAVSPVLHIVFIGLEVAKLTTLLILGLTSANKAPSQNQSSLV
ncbi:MAG TPA: hypothetical protein VGL56_04535 [Fimbriimonadaceae bacterium]|jgi:hypothetical protein